MTNTVYGTSGADYLTDRMGSVLAGGAGNDTYETVTSSLTVVEGLNQGIDTVKAWCSFALPANVENLVVAAGNSSGVGNELANVITLNGSQSAAYGGAGDDTLIDAGAGQNLFSFSTGTGHDTVQGFNTSAANHDTIQLRDFGLNTFSQVQSHLSQQGADVLVSLNPSDSVTLKNTSVAALNADDFFLQGPPAHGQATFTDDFNALSLYNPSADTGTWKTNYWFGSQSGANDWNSRTIGAGEQVLFVDPSYKGTASSALGLNPFSIQNGVASLTVAKAPAADVASLHGQQYTAGLLTTQETFAQTYGYFEIRASTPAGQGLWPAFWLLPKDNSASEIDVFEQVNDGFTHETTHTTDPNAKTTSIATYFANQQGDGQFHTYGVMWTQQSLTYYVDGVAVGETATPSDLNKPMYMIASMGGGGSWPGSLSADFTSASMKIDYVHAYALPTGETDSYGLDGVETRHFAGIAGHGYSAYDETYSAAGVLTGKAFYDAGGNTIETDVYAADGSHTSHVISATGTADLTYDNTGDVVSEAFHDLQGQLTNTASRLTADGTALTYVGDNTSENVIGTSGDDFMLMLSGNDTVHGGAGADTIFGNEGDDRLYGEAGDDMMWGGKGQDILYGGDGNNMLFGNLGADTLYAGSGADSLYGGKDNDVLVGGTGDNFLFGDLGDDTMTGGGGHDTFVIAPGTGHDVITDFVHSQDRLDISAFVAAGHHETFSQTDQGLLLTADTGDSVLFLGLHVGDLSISGGWVV